MRAWTKAAMSTVMMAGACAPMGEDVASKASVAPAMAPWRDAEADMCSRLLRIDADRQRGQALDEGGGLYVSQWIAGYQTRWFVPDAAGWTEAWSLPQTGTWRLLAWYGDAAAPSRAFWLDSRGALLVNDADHAGGASPAPDAACGVDGEPLSTSGRARDGAWWWTRDALPLRRARVQVLADPSIALSAWKVYLVSVEQARVFARSASEEPQEFDLLDGKWPTGLMTLDQAGCGEVLGVGLPERAIAMAGSEFSCLMLPKGSVRVVGDTIELRPPSEWLRQHTRIYNESAAIGALKNLSSAQAQLQASGVCDADGDGIGEYGFFRELMGALPVPAPRGAELVSPPTLSPAFGAFTDGCIERRGYLFRMALPDSQDRPQLEAPNGGRAGLPIDPARAAEEWVVYAWPIEAGVTGTRVFMIGQNGDVLSCKNADRHFSGRSRPVPPTAALRAEANGTLRGPYAINTEAADGRTWAIIQ